jgi:hypothetical protein
MRIDRAYDAVERRGNTAISRAQRDHERPLVHLFAQPLRESALADTGFTVEEDELVPLPLGIGHVMRNRLEIRALVRTRHDRARPQTE